MAKENTAKTATAEETVKNQEDTVQKPAPNVPQESKYSIGELAINARAIFGTVPECVTAALRANEKAEYTVTEAKTIVEKFLKKEVK